MQCKHRVSLCKGGELLVAEMRTFSSKQRINTSRQSNPVQCRLEKSHPERLLEMMRPRNQNLFVEKVDWNMKCERRDNLWVIRNCPSARQQKLLVIFFLYARPLMKTDRKLNGSDKNCSLSAFCFRSHPSAPVWAEIWTRRSVGSCGHLLITAVWCLDSDHLGHCWNLTCNGKICSLY